MPFTNNNIKMSIYSKYITVRWTTEDVSTIGIYKARPKITIRFRMTFPQPANQLNQANAIPFCTLALCLQIMPLIKHSLNSNSYVEQ